MKLLDDARGLPSVTKLLLATNALSSLGGGLVFPFLWIYLSDIRHMSSWVPASALAVQAAAAVVGGLAYGTLLSRWSYRAVVPLANVHAGVGTLLFAVADRSWIALVAAAVFGSGISGVGGVVRAAYGATTSGEQRETAYSLDFGLLNVMMGLGVVLGGVLTSVDIGSLADRYGLLYALDALTFLVMAVATFKAVPSAAKDDASEEKPSRHNGYRRVLGQSQLVVVLSVLSLMALASFAQFRAGLPGYLTQSGAISAGGLSATFTLNIVLCAVVQFVGMPLLKGIPRSLLVAASGVMFTLCWVCVLFAGRQTGGTALALACLGAALLSIGEALVVPLLSTMLNNLVQDDLRGEANALFQVAMSTTAVIGPVLAGAMLPWQEGVPFLVLLIAMSLVGTFLTLALRRSLPDEAPGTDTVGTNTAGTAADEESDAGAGQAGSDAGGWPAVAANGSGEGGN
ncbi:MFS transporter [Streptomyces avermitilis]|uniref:MFS transporter n=1 Tax=Streptomyces avermitilis TaxID=33903 RepID=UPI0038272EDD